MLRSPVQWTLQLAVVAAIAVTPLAARATDYFFSASRGDDAWSGTLPEPNASRSDGPKKSTAEAQLLLESTARAGDRVLFRMGDTWTGVAPALHLSKTKGSSQQPITVGVYGAGAPPLWDFASDTGEAIILLGPNTAYLSFEGLHFTTSAPAGQRPMGVRVGGVSQLPVAHHLRFQGLVVENLTGGFAVYANDLDVANSVIRNNFKIPTAGESGHCQGIWVGHSDRTVLRGNLIENNGKPDSVFDHNIYLSGGSGAVVEQNILTGTDGLKLRKTKDTLVRRNTFKALNLGAVGLGGDVDGGATNIVIEQNVIQDTINGVYLAPQSTTGDLDPGIDGVIIRNNIFRNPRVQKTYWLGQKGYVMLGSYKIRNVWIYGNLFYDLTNREGGLLRAAVYVQNGTIDPQNVSIKNNIYHRSAPDAPMVMVERDSVFQTLALDNNLYACGGCNLVSVGSTGYATLSALRAKYPALERSGAVGDPMFAGPPGDLHLSAASSLAIDRGASLAGLLDVDHEGRARPKGAAPDIGPYEFEAGAALPPAAPALLPPE